MSEHYDFYAIGKRHAYDAVEEIKRLAEEYEKNYGEEARKQFETGVSMGMANEISQYAFVSEVFKEEYEKFDMPHHSK